MKSFRRTRRIEGRPPVTLPWGLTFLGIIAATVAAMVWNHTGSTTDQVEKSTVAAADLAALGLGITVLGVLYSRFRTRKAPVSAEIGSEWLERLATVMLSTWSNEAGRRRIVTPAPAVVRWRWVGDKPSPWPVPVPGTAPPIIPIAEGMPSVLSSGVVTRIHDELYARLPHGRLVLVGPAGSGKSGSMLLLMLAALDQRRSRTESPELYRPVPVWLSLGDWNPIRESLRQWAASTIARDYPSGWSQEVDERQALVNMEGGKMALFLDGLDEMPKELRTRALKRISEECVYIRVVLTSRTDEYTEAAAVSRLTNAAVVELQPLRPAAAARYLLRDQNGAYKPQWQQLARRIVQDPDGPLARTLNSPLYLSLVRDTYEASDPSRLLDARSFPDAPSVRMHLIERLFVVAYPEDVERSRAIRWLGFVARHMDGNRDISWWRTAYWVPGWQLGLLVAIPLTIFGVTLGLRSSFSALDLAIISLCSIVLPSVSLQYASMHPEKDWLSAQPVVITPRVPSLKDLALLFLRSYGAILGFTFVFSATIALWASVSSTWRDQFMLGWGDSGLPWPGGVPGMAVAGFAVGALLGLLITPAWVFNSLLAKWATPSHGLPASTPTSTYNASLRAHLLSGLSQASVFAVLYVVIASISGWRTRDWVTLCILTAMIFLGIGISSPWYVDVVLSIRHKERVRLIRILQESCGRELLRQVGANYQFRHAALQDYLAENAEGS
jgi:hypothetical protein